MAKTIRDLAGEHVAMYGSFIDMKIGNRGGLYAVRYNGKRFRSHCTCELADKVATEMRKERRKKK